MTEYIHDYDHDEAAAVIDSIISSAGSKAKGNSACMVDFAQLLIHGGAFVAIKARTDAQRLLFKEICSLPLTKTSMAGDAEVGQMIEKLVGYASKLDMSRRERLVDDIREVVAEQTTPDIPNINVVMAGLQAMTELLYHETKDARVCALVLISLANEIENTPIQ